MNKVNEKPNIILACVFTLLVKRNEKKSNPETYIDDSLYISCDNNEEVFKRFIRISIGEFVPTHLLNNNDRNYYRNITSNNGIRTWLTDDNTIEDSFKTYIENYSQDNVKFNENKQIWKKYISDFEKKYLNNNLIISNIIINSVEYLPIIAWGYFQNIIHITEIKFSIPKEKIFFDNNKSLFVYSAEEEDSQFNHAFQDYNFTCVLDLSDYKATKNKKQTYTDKLLNEIDKMVKQRGEGSSISLIELKEIIIFNSGKTYVNNNRRIENVVSEYRTKKADTLTLQKKEKNEEYYLIIQK